MIAYQSILAVLSPLKDRLSKLVFSSKFTDGEEPRAVNLLLRLMQAQDEYLLYRVFTEKVFNSQWLMKYDI